MKRETFTIDGEEKVMLIPETDEEAEELARRVKDGEIGYIGGTPYPGDRAPGESGESDEDEAQDEE